MANQFIGALKQVERMMNSSLFGYSHSALQQLDGLALAMANEGMRDCEYMKLLELYARKYKQANEKKRLRFCLMRMQEILWLKEHKEFQKDFCRIVFTNEQLDEYTLLFLEDYPSFLNIYEERFRKRILAFMTLIYVLILALCVLGFGWQFWTVFAIDLCLFGGVNYYCFRFAYKKILDSQFEEKRSCLEENFLKMDQMIQIK